MDIARPAYADGQNDKGKTPGVHAVEKRMSTRFAQNPAAPAGPPTPPKG
ncbi:hypothetical protein [Hymenobacter terricola]|nr:hypothetical protein [Hymenobacter terricola]